MKFSSKNAFPNASEIRKYLSLNNLKGDKTVLEYEVKFTQLVRYAPHMIDTDYKRLEKN